MTRTLGLVLFLASVVSGCATAHRAKPPPARAFDLGLSRATYRDYAGTKSNICDAEPRWLFDELSSVNGLLARFLDSTSAGYDGAWSSDQRDLLEKGSRTLGPLLDVHEANLKAADRCGFSDDRGFPVLIRRGLGYVKQTRERLVEGPKILAYLLAKETLALWRKERPLHEIEAKRHCPDRVKVGAAELYYAWQSEQGRTQWLFCDGARVVQAGDKKEFELPAGLSRWMRRRIRAARYLKAASNYPLINVDTPPKLPERSTGAADSAG